MKKPGSGTRVNSLVIGAGRVGFLLEQIEIQEKGHPLRKAKLEDEVIKKC